MASVDSLTTQGITNAIAAAIATIPAPTANPVTSTDVTKIVKLTQAAYDALTPKISTTLYVISG